MRELEIVRYVEAIDEWVEKDKATALRLVVGLIDTITGSKSRDLDKWQTIENTNGIQIQPSKIEYVFVRGNYPIPRRPDKKKRNNRIPVGLLLELILLDVMSLSAEYVQKIIICMFITLTIIGRITKNPI